MSNQFYIKIGVAFVWCMKYIFIPFGIAFFVRILADRVSQPHPRRQRKKRSYNDRLK